MIMEFLNNIKDPLNEAIFNDNEKRGNSNFSILQIYFLEYKNMLTF